MKSFTGFRLSLFSFLDRHPLYPYRDDAGELKVLLIGYGQRILDDILPTVATNGQLLDSASYHAGKFQPVAVRGHAPSEGTLSATFFGTLLHEQAGL